MPQTQTLSMRFHSLAKKNQQRAFYDYLHHCYPQAETTSFGIQLGDPNNAKLVLSARFSHELSGVAVLMELLTLLTEPCKAMICFVFASKQVIFPGKLHISIGDLSKGNSLIIAATAAARKGFGNAIKKAFHSGRDHSLQFCHAESLIRRYKKDRYELHIRSGWKRSLFRRRSSPDNIPFHSDPTGVKLVCEGIARLIKAI